MSPLILVLILAGCSLFGGAAETPEPPTATPPAATATALQLAPTLPPATTQSPLGPPTLTASPTLEGGITATPEATGTSAAPTALPAPTEISAAATGPAAPALPVSGPGISMNPDLGMPGEVVVVDGTGFEPNTGVTLHWGPTDGPTGPTAQAITTDAEGKFQIALRVPPAEQWPGGGAEEMEFIQLRARYQGEFFYFANYRYVVRFNPQSPVLPFNNSNEGYTVTVFNGWKWEWEGEATEDVRFASGSGGGKGFILALDGTNVSALIPAVMAVEAPGQAYTTSAASIGKYPGSQATTTGGLIVLFIPSNGRTFVLSFTNDAGQNAIEILGTFTLS
ncbi:MAG: hypothetical protein IT326_01280 [Anaerolineae bacterium]|nr:hypothetical protein [Anaerolineae bacterium]